MLPLLPVQCGSFAFCVAVLLFFVAKGPFSVAIMLSVWQFCPFFVAKGPFSVAILPFLWQKALSVWQLCFQCGNYAFSVAVMLLVWQPQKAAKTCSVVSAKAGSAASHRCDAATRKKGHF